MTSIASPFTVRLVNGIMRLNGERIVFNGVNRHEWNAAKGRAIDADDMYTAMAVLKKNNINAVRTCHYPNQSLWYDLCDQNGIYMMDETNLESHGSWLRRDGINPEWNVPGSFPEWEACVVDRARNMLERDKNHATVLIWSCGNESYAGTGILAIANFFRKRDPSRLVHYESCVYNRAFSDCTDMESRMYAKPSEIREYLQSKPQKPFLLCEYMHDMGNSLGGLESYMRLLNDFEQYQGGFIWDYMDQLWHTDAAGRRALGYGGDFGERATNYNFSGNGIVYADGKEKPAMQDVRYWFADEASRTAHDARNAEAAAQADRELAAVRAARRKAPLTVVEGDGEVGVKGKNFEVLFSYGEAGLSSLKIDGYEWMWRAPRPAFWRAGTDNDRGCGFPQRAAAWMTADIFAQCIGWKLAETSQDRVVMRYTFAVPMVPDVTADVTYTVEAEGTLLVQAEYHGAPNAPELPCFGIKFQTTASVSRTQWVGLSGETYPDRCKGGVFGCWQEIPHVEPALVPQDCGIHMQTRQVMLQRDNAFGRIKQSLTLEAVDKPFAFSALPNTAQEIEAAQHIEELPVTGRTSVTVLGAVRGVGGIDSWGTDVEEPYRISGAQDHSVVFRIVL